MEQRMTSQIALYFGARQLFEKHDPNSLPSLNVFPFFKRENIKAYLDKHYRFTPAEEKEFLSWSLECIFYWNRKTICPRPMNFSGFSKKSLTISRSTRRFKRPGSTEFLR